MTEVISPLAAQVSQSTAGTSRAASQLAGNFDTFLTLLTTQLRNQDPLNPLDTEKFTEQLVQFSGVEQSIETNQNLETLIAMQAAGRREAAIGFLDRTVASESDIALAGDAAWTVSLPEGISSASYYVVDEAGEKVGEIAGPTSAGVHVVNWAGDIRNDARIRLIVDARDRTSAPLDATIYAHQRVEGIDFNETGAVLRTAIASIPVSDVRRVIGE